MSARQRRPIWAGLVSSFAKFCCPSRIGRARWQCRCWKNQLFSMNTLSNNNLLPRGWILGSIGEVTEILDSKRIPVNSNDRQSRIAGKKSDELFPYYGATGQVGSIDGYLFDGEFVLLGEDGAPFLEHFKDKAYLVNGKFWVNNHAHILRSLSSNKYLCHYLNQVDYSGFVTGTTRLKLNQASMRKIPVKLPPLAEQHRIVAKIEELFSDLDAGIASLKQAQAQLKTYRQAVLKYAFEGKLTAAWREQNKPEPAEKLLAQIKVGATRRVAPTKRHGKSKKPKEFPPLTEAELAELPELPEGWCWTRLNELLSDTLIGIVRNLKEQNDQENGIQYVKMNNITSNGTMDFSDMIYVEVNDEEKEKYLLKNNDILFNTRNSYELVGKTGIIRDDSREMVFNNNLMRIRLHCGVSPLYVWHQINSPWFQKALVKGKKATTNICALYAKDVLPMKIALSSESEQRQIVQEIESRLSVCDKLEESIKESLLKAEALRQSILKKAFEGKLVPQDPNDEPAEKLLERIKSAKL